jgi:hypothetical protein
VIDLIVLRHVLGSLPEAAWEKARAAYGPSIDSAWEHALRGLKDRPDVLGRWLDALGVLPNARAVIQHALSSVPATPRE